MIEEYAVVVGCSGHQATLEIERRTACGLCGQTRGCGNATWGKLLGHKDPVLVADNAVNAKVGDSVVVGIDERAVLNTTFFLYGVPLMGLLISTVLADYWFDNELYVLLSAIVGLGLSFLWVKYFLMGRHVGKVGHWKYQAVILRQADVVMSDKAH